MNCIWVIFIGIYWLSSIAKWRSVVFYNLLTYQMNGNCRSAPAVQRRDWLEWKAPQLLPLCIEFAYQINGSVLYVSLAKSLCLIYQSLRAYVEMLHRFRRRLSVQGIVSKLLASGYWSRRPAMCRRLTLDHRRWHRLWRRRTEGGPHTLCLQWWVSLQTVTLIKVRMNTLLTSWGCVIIGTYTLFIAFIQHLLEYIYCIYHSFNAHWACR